MYAKTEKGVAAIQGGDQYLDSEVRRALILIDGKNTAGTLVASRSALGANLDAMSKLLVAGYIEPLKRAPNAPTPTPTELAPPRDPRAGTEPKPPIASIERSIVKARAQLANLISDMLGPNGTSLALKAERATTISELRGPAEQCRAFLESIGQRRKGQTFWTAAQALID